MLCGLIPVEKAKKSDDRLKMFDEPFAERFAVNHVAQVHVDEALEHGRNLAFSLRLGDKGRQFEYFRLDGFKVYAVVHPAFGCFHVAIEFSKLRVLYPFGPVTLADGLGYSVGVLHQQCFMDMPCGVKVSLLKIAFGQVG